jgi:hypothetical protein
MPLKQWAIDHSLLSNIPGGEGTETPPVDTFIGGLPAIHWTSEGGDARLSYYLIKRTTGITLIWINTDSKEDSYFDQILSTVTFTDAQGNSGEPCGGIAGKKCPDGYKCQMTAMYPDAMGTCVTDVPNAGYTCPEGGYVDCMPGPNKDMSKCSSQAMTWYKINCPNFKGGAL